MELGAGCETNGDRPTVSRLARSPTTAVTTAAHARLPLANAVSDAKAECEHRQKGDRQFHSCCSVEQGTVSNGSPQCIRAVPVTVPARLHYATQRAYNTTLAI